MFCGYSGWLLKVYLYGQQYPFNKLLALQLLIGMRLGEVGALSWNDIDEEANVIHVRRTITRTEDGIFYIGDSPKTDAGARDIPMNKD